MPTADLMDDVARVRAYIDEAEQEKIERLPPEPQLSKDLDISRGRLRTVLKTLEAEGLIWRHVGRGTFIGPKRADPESPDWAKGISLNDIMDARMMLEPQLAAQAAIHATAENLEAMDRCLADMANTSSYMHWKRGDDKLHRLIAEATANKLALLMYDTLRAQLRTGLDERLARVFGHEGRPSETDDQHRAVVEAIRSGDPKGAEKAMLHHLTEVRARLFGLR